MKNTSLATEDSDTMEENKKNETNESLLCTETSSKNEPTDNTKDRCHIEEGDNTPVEIEQSLSTETLLNNEPTDKTEDGGKNMDMSVEIEQNLPPTETLLIDELTDKTKDDGSNIDMSMEVEPDKLTSLSQCKEMDRTEVENDHIVEETNKIEEYNEKESEKIASLSPKPVTLDEEIDQFNNEKNHSDDFGSLEENFTVTTDFIAKEFSRYKKMENTFQNEPEDTDIPNTSPCVVDSGWSDDESLVTQLDVIDIRENDTTANRKNNNDDDDWGNDDYQTPQLSVIDIPQENNRVNQYKDDDWGDKNSTSSHVAPINVSEPNQDDDDWGDDNVTVSHMSPIHMSEADQSNDNGWGDDNSNQNVGIESLDYIPLETENENESNTYSDYRKRKFMNSSDGNNNEDEINMPPPKRFVVRKKVAYTTLPVPVLPTTEEENTENPVKKIIEEFPGYFAQELTEDMIVELNEIIGEKEVKGITIHSGCHSQYGYSLFSNSIRVFIRKVINNIQDVDSDLSYEELQASVFPFKVNPEIEVVDDEKELISQFDDEFNEKIQTFLNEHFGTDAPSFSDIVPRLFANIRSVKTNFDSDTLDKLKDSDFTSFRDNLCEYLKKHPRLNEAGAKRYIDLYHCHQSIAQKFSRPYEVREVDEDYFLFLPERNFAELFTLLDHAFYDTERDVYTNRFEKFLFFYVRAEKRCNDGLVFFIDDGLFECLKSYQRFRTCRDEPISLLWEIFLMTLIQRRRKASIERDNFNFDRDEEHLKRIETYITSFPNIADAIVEYEERSSDVMTCKAFINVQNAFLDCHFNFRHNFKVLKAFHELFLAAAFCKHDIQKLYIYSTAHGREYSVDMVDEEGKAKIRDFVKKYSNWNPSLAPPVVKGLTWGLEELFCDGTINWEQEKMVQEENTIVEEENTIVEEENNIVEEENNIVEEENNIVEKENTIVEEENIIVEKENTIVEEENIIMEEENTIVEE